jgi:endoglucanase
MEDGQAYQNSDMTGGWHDAGDFIKFTLTNAWASYALLKAYEVNGKVFGDVDNDVLSGQSNGVPDILDQVRYASDYLLKVTPNENTLIARIGGNQDHNLWVTSPYQSKLSVGEGGGKRPVYTDTKSDIAGITAASLALMSQMFQSFDNSKAQTYLEHAKWAYNFGKQHQGTTPDDGNFYSDGSFKDDMFCGAVELYRATGDTQYLNDAKGYDTELGTHNWVPDWSNVTDYCRHSLAKAGEMSTVASWKQDVDSYLTKISSDQNVSGLAYFGQWGSLRYALGAAFSSSLLYDITKEEKYKTFSLSQINYVMGQNSYNRSFIVGYGNNPPTKPHHKNGYGRDALNWDLSQPPLYSLKGALVGGPTTSGYKDDINDYVGNEVTIDYNSALVGAASFAAAQGN